MATSFHMLPLISGGKTRLQPVYVGDVAQAIVSLLIRSDLPAPKGSHIFELGGPQVFTMKMLLKEILKAIKCKAWKISIPFPIASLLGFFVGLFSPQLLSREQVKMLKKDNMLAKGNSSLKELGIQTHVLKDSFPALSERFYSSQRTHPFSTIP